MSFKDKDKDKEKKTVPDNYTRYEVVFNESVLKSYYVYAANPEDAVLISNALLYRGHMFDCSKTGTTTLHDVKKTN